MKKFAIPVSIVILLLVIVVGMYMVWQDNKSDLGTSVPPTPSPHFIPAPVPNPTPTPTAQDYKAPFKTFSGEGISVEYPSSWFALESESTNEVGVVSILSPSTKQRLDSGNWSGYEFDLYVGHSSDLPQIIGTAYTKGEKATVGGKSGYWVTLQGQDLSEGVVIEHNGYYAFSFPPWMDRALQTEILKHVKFTN